MAAGQWIWLRHAPTGVKGRFCGHTDASIAALDRDAYETVVRLLPRFDRVFVSPLKRTSQTLDALVSAGLSPLKADVVSEISEQNFGVFEDQPYDGVALPDDAGNIAAWRPERGESFLDVVDRVGLFLKWLREEASDKTCLLVTHAGAIRAMLTTTLSTTPKEALAIPIEPLSLTVVSPTALNGWKVQNIGEIHGTEQQDTRDGRHGLSRRWKDNADPQLA